MIGRCTRWEAVGAAQHQPHSVHPRRSSARTGGEATPRADLCDPANAAVGHPITRRHAAALILNKTGPFGWTQMSSHSHVGTFLMSFMDVWVLYPNIQGVVAHLRTWKMVRIYWAGLSWLTDEPYQDCSWKCFYTHAHIHTHTLMSVFSAHMFVT